MSNQEAQKLINDWFAAMPKVKEYIAAQRKAARRGERQQTMFGRVRHYVIDDGNMFHIENEYINTPIQSIASDLTLFSLIRISKWLKETGIDAKIVMTVHDSIVLEVADKSELVKLVRETCERIMAETPQMFIKNCPLPFRADSDEGYAYGIWDK